MSYGGLPSPIVYSCPSCGIRSWAEKHGDRHWPTCRWYGDNTFPGHLEQVVRSPLATVTVIEARKTRGNIQSGVTEPIEHPPRVSTEACPTCGGEVRRQQVYCCDKCRQKAYRQRVTA